MGLAFGYEIPEGTEVAWGARLIVTQNGGVDLPPGRSSMIGSSEQVASFAVALTNLLPANMLMKVISSKLRSGEINTREGREVVIIEDEGIRIVGSSRGSAGYFYVSAYPI